MKTKSDSQSASFNPRVFIAFVLCSGGVLLAVARLSNLGTGTAAPTAAGARPGIWTVTGSLATARSGHTATLLPDGKVLVAAGGGNGGLLASAEVYDPASGGWTTTGSLATARSFTTATLLPNGKVLVAGGYDNGVVFASAELYDPTSGTWSTTGSLTTARSGHTATLLPDGKVLVVGNGNLGIPGSAELYDPASGTWTGTGSPATPRQSHTATLLPNGKVLIAGGADVVALASAELYDPTSGTWSTTGSLTTARRAHVASLLRNGMVLVAGGADTDGFSLASAEVYDPASGNWATTGSLATVRSDTTATLLPDGKVLVAAGMGETGCCGALASAELYTSGGTMCISPPVGLVSWWSGDRTADDVQGVNNGTLLNGTSFTKGMVGPGFLFDGSNDWVRIPDSPSLNQTRITIDAWFYLKNQNTNRRIIGKDDANENRQYSVGIDIFNLVEGFVTLPSGLIGVTSFTQIQFNTWYHVAMTHDGLKLRLYINGVEESEVDAVGDIVPTVAPFVIGGDQGREFTNGIIDEAQIFSRALTDEEILAIYQAGAAGQCKPDIFVSSINPSYTAFHSRYLVSTSVTVQDANGNGITGATVNMKIRLPSGSELGFSEETDENGNANFSFYTSDTGLYKFKVTRVTDPIRRYDPSLNIETTDTLVIP